MNEEKEKMDGVDGGRKEIDVAVDLQMADEEE